MAANGSGIAVDDFDGPDEISRDVLDSRDKNVQIDHGEGLISGQLSYSQDAHNVKSNFQLQMAYTQPAIKR